MIRGVHSEGDGSDGRRRNGAISGDGGGCTGSEHKSEKSEAKDEGEQRDDALALSTLSPELIEGARVWAQKEVDGLEAQAARGDLVAQEGGEKLARGLLGLKKKQLEALTAKVAETEAAAAAAKDNLDAAIKAFELQQA